MARRLENRQTVPASEIGHGMSVTHINAKGRRSKQPSFVSFRKDVFLHSAVYKSLSYRAKALLIDLTMQFNGKNNGDLLMTWTYMHDQGWGSTDALYAAKKELLEKGLLEVTRHGGLGFPSLYAVTWWSIDDCNGKLDVRPTKVPRSWWRDWQPPDKDNSK